MSHAVSLDWYSELFADQLFSNLHTIQRAPLTGIVGHQPEIEALLMAGILTQSRQIDLILTRPMGDRGDDFVIDHLQARCAGQGGTDIIQTARITGLQMYHLVVAIEHRYANTGGIDQQLLVFQQTARLLFETLLFAGKAIVLHIINLRDQVERDLRRIG